MGAIKDIYRKLNSKGYMPKHVAEVGVYHPETSNIYDYIRVGVRTMLVEPDPSSIDLIKKHFAGQDNITLHEVAVYKKSGEIQLAQRNASTFVAELESSPALVNDDYQLSENDTFVVKAVTFDQLDAGDIDLLSIDIEGSEWFVIKHMKSRPAVISVETHGAMYINPNLDKIETWMEQNNYRAWYKDNSDTVYVRPDIIPVTLWEKIQLKLKTVHLLLRRYKKTLKKKFKKNIKH